MRQHWVAEQVFDRAGVGAVHLRAAVFHENLTVLVAIGDWRELRLPLGSRDTVVPLVAASDVARVGAGLVLEPSPVDPVCRLTGEVPTIGEIADTFGVKYVEVSDGEWRDQAVAVGYDPHAVEHLSKLWALFRTIGSGHSLYRVTEEIERIGGQPPRTLRDHLRRRAVPA
jgi:uncharacterized protein YbjT (DUF2867 family)